MPIAIGKRRVPVGAAAGASGYPLSRANGVAMASRPPKGNPMTHSTQLPRLEPVLLAGLRIVAGVLFLSHGLSNCWDFRQVPRPANKSF